MGGDHGNFIDGRWRPVEAGKGFVVVDEKGAELARRPRSTSGDLEEVFGALEGASHAWWVRAPEERAERVRAMDFTGHLGTWAGAFGARVGVDAAAAGQLLKEDLSERDWSESAVAAGPGIALVRAAPTALLSGLLPLVASALERGWCVLLMADPALPWLAEAVVSAWERGGGADALALLHDDSATTARSALSSGRLSGVLARDHSRRLEELEAAMSPSEAKGFGEGVVGSKIPGARFEGALVRDSTAVVTSELDPEEEAAAICDAAFGAALALGGEREGSVGRVVCHEALFSVFTRVLLERFDALERVEGGLNEPLQAGLGAWSEEIAQLAVGEGATCLRGGPSDSIERGRRGKIIRSVFTNVEPKSRLSRASRPAPALALMRASSDAEVHKLALACDADPI
jgi:acyl-CoA reductase-like NAD-dependent aldehyde dehydrogenase